jgi:hypothetical protein
MLACCQSPLFILHLILISHDLNSEALISHDLKHRRLREGRAIVVDLLPGALPHGTTPLLHVASIFLPGFGHQITARMKAI